MNLIEMVAMREHIIINMYYLVVSLVEREGGYVVRGLGLSKGNTRTSHTRDLNHPRMLLGALSARTTPTIRTLTTRTIRTPTTRTIRTLTTPMTIKAFKCHCLAPKWKRLKSWETTVPAQLPTNQSMITFPSAPLRKLTNSLLRFGIEWSYTRMQSTD